MAFCYPSNAGLSIQHAMGYGVPVIVSDDGSKNAPEWVAVEPGVSGPHYAAGSAADLAEQIALLVDDAKLRRRLGAAGRAKVLAENTIEQMADGFQEAIGYCIEQSRR